MSAVLKPITELDSIISNQLAHRLAEFFSEEHCIKRYIAQHGFVILQHTLFKIRLGPFSSYGEFPELMPDFKRTANAFNKIIGKYCIAFNC